MCSWQVAEHWLFPSCQTACARLLATKGSHTLLFAFQELPVVFDTQVFHALKRGVEERFVAQFSNPSAVLSCPEKLQLLVALPHYLMLALLKDSRLCTDSEASVLLYLRAWYLHNQDTCSLPELELLKQEVRYGCIHPFYILQALPLMPDELALTGIQHREVTFLQSCAASVIPEKERWRYRQSCPPQWFNKRPKPRGTPSVISLQLRVSREALLAHVAAVAAMDSGGSAPARLISKSKLAQGYEWSLFFASDTGASALSVGVEIKLPFSDSAIVTQECRIHIKALTTNRPKILGEQTKKWICKEVAWPDCFQNKSMVLGDQGLAPWRKYLGEGDICIVALVECISAEERIREQAKERSEEDAEKEVIELEGIDHRFTRGGGVDEDFSEEEYSEKGEEAGDGMDGGKQGEDESEADDESEDRDRWL